MPALSKHYALLDFYPGDPTSVPVEPISVNVTADETHAPYVTATVVVPTTSLPFSPDPRYAQFYGLRLQQDFGDLIYNYELTASFGGDVSAITAAYSGTQTTRTNFVTNPSFEVDTTSWSLSGSSTISRVTAEKYSGVAALQAVTTAVDSGTQSAYFNGLSPNTAYVYSLWIKGEPGKLSRLALRELTSADVSVGVTVGSNVTMTGSWQRISITRTLGATGAKAQLYVSNRTAGAHTFYVDAIQLQAGSTATDYFDGSLPDGLNVNNNWTGTANASASTQLSGDLVNAQEITRDYAQPWNIFETGLPIATVTAAYGGDVSDLTAAGLIEIWRMSDFLHSSGTFNPAPSTIFDGYLMLRSVVKDYVSGETTLELTSHEAILLDSIGYPSDLAFAFTSLRDIINFVLADTIGALTQLQPGASDYTYSPAYSFLWLPNQTAWDILDVLVKAANLVLFCDEKGDWYLEPAASVAGDLYLKDDDNITTLSSRIDRNSGNFFDYAVVEYRNEGSVPVYKNFGVSGFPISKDAYFLVENVEPPASGNAAQSMVWRAVTRGETYEVEAIANYDARPRQNMTIDVTGEAVKTAIIQSVTWSLPSARMSVDIRDLQEV